MDPEPIPKNQHKKQKQNITQEQIDQLILTSDKQ